MAATEKIAKNVNRNDCSCPTMSAYASMTDGHGFHFKELRANISKSMGIKDPIKNNTVTNLTCQS